MNFTRKSKVLFLFIILVLLAGFITNSQASRGIPVTVKTPEGNQILLYKNSYALVIGNGNYTRGWDPLPGALRDVEDVAEALKQRGFQVQVKKDLTRDNFEDLFNKFIIDYGRQPDNQLLIYYAGHGYTEKLANEDDLGYLVMIDTPIPEQSLFRFRRRSVDMQTIITYAKMIRSKHVLFMFDSCFSGSVLNMRDRVIPSAISDHVRHPVRQFITAGRANERVPDRSFFKEAFLNMLEGREREPIPDGYLTGEELGLYLKNKVPMYNSAQHPQYGKIRDPKLDQGDFVFPKRETDELALCKLTVERLERENELLIQQIEEYKRQSAKDSKVGGGKPLSTGVAPPPSSTSSVTGRDGIYVAYANGIVRDTRTGLEWVAGPDRDTTWDEAKSWLESLNIDGGGWRMPMRGELKTLYKRYSGTRNMTSLLKTSGWWVWAAETEGSSYAWFFPFIGTPGPSSSQPSNMSNNLRAFAVRSRSD